MRPAADAQDIFLKANFREVSFCLEDKILDNLIIRLYNKLYDRIITRRDNYMGNTLKKLGEAELEIMQVIWDSENPVTSNYILKELQGRRRWQLSTLMTSLTRLADKGFISCDRSTGRNLYSSIISENEYKAGASKHFLDKLYNNSIQSMIATLYNNRAIKNSDIEELRNFLDQLEDER